MPEQPTIRFAVTGLNHGHIYGQTDLLLAAGAEPVGFFAPEDDLAGAFAARYPNIPRVDDVRAILEDESIHLVINAGVPCERGPFGVRVMQHGKDYMSDKPAFTTPEQLEAARRVQATTGRIYSICYSERLTNRATVKAGELVKAGAIGRVLQTISLGPHLARLHTRPDWFFERAKYGGIITDIGSHNFDQFLFFTGSTQAEIVAAQVANFNHPEHPGLEDFGDVMVRGDGGTGYIRVDWFTPAGLGVWGDGRLVVLGTDGYIELRKYIDVAGRPGGDHLFLVNQEGVQHIDCSSVELPYGRQLIDDILNRTETALPQTHAFLAMELALTAQAQAARLGHLT
ncbi:MAG: Gfo/Idh/MocA family oxidoreductase [Anaerolineae bacterium]|nr:Gfo/Idh/MocA family oxidoreductase [Anaerolineae bacterium]